MLKYSRGNDVKLNREEQNVDVVFTLFPVICDENMHIVIYLTSLFPAHFLTFP